MTLQLGQVIEGVGPAEFAGVDQAHEHVADMRAAARLVEHRIFTVENRLFDDLSIMPSLF